MRDPARERIASCRRRRRGRAPRDRPRSSRASSSRSLSLRPARSADRSPSASPRARSARRDRSSLERRARHRARRVVREAVRDRHRERRILGHRRDGGAVGVRARGTLSDGTRRPPPRRRRRRRSAVVIPTSMSDCESSSRLLTRAPPERAVPMRSPKRIAWPTSPSSVDACRAGTPSPPSSRAGTRRARRRAAIVDARPRCGDARRPRASVTRLRRVRRARCCRRRAAPTITTATVPSRPASSVMTTRSLRDEQAIAARRDARIDRPQRAGHVVVANERRRRPACARGDSRAATGRSSRTRRRRAASASASSTSSSSSW